MVGKLARCVLLVGAFNNSTLAVAYGAPVMPLGIHREDVNAAHHPWSSIGKLYNETGGSCSGVVISRDKILTAAHCIFNARTRRFIPADCCISVGATISAPHATYDRRLRSGDDETSSDWAVLPESPPAAIERHQTTRSDAFAFEPRISEGRPAVHQGLFGAPILVSAGGSNRGIHRTFSAKETIGTARWSR
jgi:protease YdgD